MENKKIKRISNYIAAGVYLLVIMILSISLMVLVAKSDNYKDDIFAACSMIFFIFFFIPSVGFTLGMTLVITSIAFPEKHQKLLDVVEDYSDILEQSYPKIISKTDSFRYETACAAGILHKSAALEDSYVYSLTELSKHINS